MRDHKMEHRRRRGHWEMGVLGVVASACLIGASTGVQATSAGTPIHLNSVTMESTTAGWGIDRHLGGQLVHTVDGGRAWTNVTPPGVTFDEPTNNTSYSPPLPPHNTVTWYGSSLVAKTITQLARSAQGTAVLLVSTTTNGGRQWHQWKVRLPDLVDRSMNDPILHQVDFVNANDGWLIFGPAYPSAAGMNYVGMELWHTSNGGHTWIRMNQSAEIITGPIAFISATMGWTTRRVGMNPRILLHTMNAGRTWTRVSLAAGAPVGVPIFHDAIGVVFVARQNLTQDFPVTYHVIASMDAGRHWEPARRIPEPTSVVDASFFTVPVNNPKIIWDLSGHTLWRSINSGRTWTVQSRAKVLTHNPFLDAVNRRSVWAWNPTVSTSPTISRTTDGGRTWTSWTPVLMP